jgi:8-oxo-dGTP pyrophosphatase MutT (NUDIX family)
MKSKCNTSTGEVVMVIRRPQNKVLLTTKSFYPPGIYRLPSGQISGCESPDAAFQRELTEETGIRGVGYHHVETVSFTFYCNRECLDYTSYLFVTDPTERPPKPIDAEEAIAGFREIPSCDLNKIAKLLANLKEPWHDWGRFRAVPHEIAYEFLCLKKVSG